MVQVNDDTHCSHGSCNCLLLKRDQFLDSLAAKRQQLRKLAMVESSFFTCALKFYVFVLVSHHKIHIDLGIDILFVIQIQQWNAIYNPHADSSNTIHDRACFEKFLIE